MSLECRSYVIIGLTGTSVLSIPTRMLEISLLTLRREDVQLLNTSGLPRAENRLTLSFSPNRSIPIRAMEETEILNSTVKDEVEFSEEDFEIINRFINRLPKPVCVISYEGENYDFKILRKELQNIEKCFDKGVYCVSLRKAVRALCTPTEYYDIKHVYRELTGNDPHEIRTAENTLAMTTEILAKMQGRLTWMDENSYPIHDPPQA